MTVQTPAATTTGHSWPVTYARISFGLSLLAAPLLTLAYLATDDGREFLTGTVALWAEPASRALAGLLTFADPDRVYTTYTQVMALLVPAILAGAVSARARRQAAIRAEGRAETRAERIGWWTSIIGYAVVAGGLLAIAAMLTVMSANSAAINGIFLGVLIPGLLTSLIGSTVLGVVLIRRGYPGRATRWLLALSLPLWVIGSVVIGHNSIGLVPLIGAWALAPRGDSDDPA